MTPNQLPRKIVLRRKDGIRNDKHDHNLASALRNANQRMPKHSGPLVLVVNPDFE